MGTIGARHGRLQATRDAFSRVVRLLNGGPDGVDQRLDPHLARSVAVAWTLSRGASDRPQAAMQVLGEHPNPDACAALVQRLAHRDDSAPTLPPGAPIERARALGWTYAALLDVGVVRAGQGHPLDVTIAGRNPELGAYYTPDAVVDEVVGTTLAPILARCPTVESVLALRACDPAAGSGAFLLGVVDHLARAVVDRSRGTLSHSQAVSKVIATSVYGLDLDPLTVGVLRRVLAVAAGGCVAGHRVKVGDALVGLTPAQIDAGDWEPTRSTGVTVHPSSRASFGDAVVAAFFAERSPAARRRRLQELRSGAPIPAGWTPPPDLQAVLDSPHLTPPLRPLHWEEAFPRVFTDHCPGFDIVVANPPFRSARSVDSASRRTRRDLLRVLHPEFAAGAFDASTVFWSRVSSTLLCRTGRYGMLIPTASLSSTGRWQARVDGALRPDHLILYPVDRFADARVRTTAVIGGRGVCIEVDVVDHDQPTTLRSTVSWDAVDGPWFAAARHAECGPAPRAPRARLGDLLSIRAGCATDAAYQLAPLVEDRPDARGKALVTTGAIDRYKCMWGARRIRFLGRDFTAPRWPTDPRPRPVARSLAAQDGAKLLVAGLTAVLETWFDRDGVAAGVVSTWVLQPRGPVHDTVWWAWLGLLNSASFSRIYMGRHGGASMSGRQTTVKKAALADMSVPAVLGHPPPEQPVGPIVHPWASSTTDPQRIGQLARLARRLQCVPDDPLTPLVDTLAHGTAAALYGYSAAEANASLMWWQERTRQEVCAADWTHLVTRLRTDGSPPA